MQTIKKVFVSPVKFTKVHVRGFVNEPTICILVLNVTSRKNLKPNTMSECWSPVACSLYLTQYQHLSNKLYSQFKLYTQLK